MREVPLRLRMKKEQREEVKRKHPNLAEAPVNYTLKTFKAPKNEIKGMSDEQFKELAKQLMNRGCRVPDRELKEEEKVDLVLDVKNNSDAGRPPLWEGKVEIPNWMQGKQTEQTKMSVTLPKSLRTLLESNGSETTS